MLEASNLGQILGRALYGALELRAQPELVAAADKARAEEQVRQRLEAERREREDRAARALAESIRREARPARRRAALKARESQPAPAPVKAPRRGRAGALEALLDAHPAGLDMGAIKRALGIATHTAVRLLRLLPIERLGKRRSYVYQLRRA